MTHRFIPTNPPPKHSTGKVCKHCKVDVFIMNGKAYPVLGKQHKPSCPRARNLN